MKTVFEKIEQITPRLSDWCGVEKAQTLACLVVGLHPAVAVEIGVWQGASAIPMGLALKHVHAGCLYAIDPWSGEASVASQTTDADKLWWHSVDHERAYQNFLTFVHAEGLQDIIRIVRATSDDFTPPDIINLLHIDGRHDDGAINDVARYAPKVPLGGIVIMDDLDWVGGGVRKAEKRLLEMGFDQLYPLGSGAVYQRKRYEN